MRGRDPEDRGFLCFCLIAQIGVQEVQDVQTVQEVQMVQGVQKVQDVQDVQGVQLRPIRILRPKMKDSSYMSPFTEQSDFYISIHFF